MVGIIPKRQCKADFCGNDPYFYIIRPDLTCYMRSTNLNNGDDLEIFSLHPTCRNGDHYLASDDYHFYIIQSSHYRRVLNMTRGDGAAIYALHPNCQGGDHYYSAFGYFYIIFQSQSIYRRTKNMNKDEEGDSFPLHPKCKNGLYYFGTKNYFYFVNPDDQQGIQYTRSTNLNKNENAEIFSFHTSIYSFLPGGLAIAKGPSYGEWVCIKTISNGSETPVEWQNKVKKKIGYNKETISSMQHSWKVSLAVAIETEGLSALIAKYQFSLAAEFGGIGSNTDKQTWSETTEIEEIFTLNLQPHQNIYIYVYQLGLGKDPVLHCRHMRILDSPIPPTDNPLPPAVEMVSIDL